LQPVDAVKAIGLPGNGKDIVLIGIVLRPALGYDGRPSRCWRSECGGRPIRNSKMKTFEKK